MSKNKILLIDDEMFILEVLKRILDSENYEIHLCANPSEAKKLIIENEYSVVVTDNQMPDLNGVDLLTDIEVSKIKAVKILMSGFSDLDVVIKAINSGLVWRYIQKPWVNEDVKIAISNAIDLYEEKNLKEKYMNQVIAREKELEVVNAKLLKLIEERTKTLEERSRLLKLLATTDDQSIVMHETLKSLSLACGDLNFRIVMDKPTDSRSYPIINEKQILGYIAYDTSDELLNELVFSNMQIYAPIIEFCLTLIEGKAKAESIFNELGFLLNEGENA